MTARTTDVLVIGSGIAGAQAVETLLDASWTGSVLVVGGEHEYPYERPVLTKGALAGTDDRESATHLDADWWSQRDVELRLGVRVTALDLGGKVATLDDGDEVTFERALVATGSTVATLDADGTALGGVHSVRTFDDVDALRADAEGAERAVVVGGGYLGSEAAAVLSAAHGATVTEVLRGREPLQGALGETVGARIAAVLTGHGVSLRREATVTRLRPAKADGARVGGVELDDGTTIEADVVVTAVGGRPATAFLDGSGAGLEDDGGVRTDERLVVAPGVWAAGDVAAYASALHGGERVRVEHVEHARAQGAYVAATWLGREDGPYAEVPMFYSDLSDWIGFEALGSTGTGDEEVVEGDLEDASFVVWYLDGGRPVGWVSVGFHGSTDLATPIVARGLGGEAVPRDELVSVAPAD